MDDPIVVTGMGAVTPLAAGVHATWARLIAGRSGIVANDRFDTTGYAAGIAGLVPSKAHDPEGFDPTAVMAEKELRKTDLFIHYAVAAANEALAQAGWAPDPETAAGLRSRSRTATVIATGVGGLPAITGAVGTIRERGPRRISPFLVPSFLPNLATGQISIRYGFSGPSGAPVTACAASAQAIGDGMRMIRAGEADVALVGGAEASVDPVAIGGFGAAKALASGFENAPETASRPFDRGHAGFVLAEGAAMLVIERRSHALARGAKVLAEIAGYGTTTDAHHVTAGWPDGREAARAMAMALEMAGIGPGEVDYINAHSTSTPVGDAAELAAIGSVFPGRGRDLALGSTKGATGHMLGAAGAAEAVIGVMALREGTVPPGLNLDDPVPEALPYELARDGALARPLRHVLSNAFGFGGVNAALVFRRAG